MTSLAALPPDAAQTAEARAPERRGKRRIPLALKFAAALIGLVTLVLISNGAVNLWLNEEEAKRAVVGVQQEKARAAADRVDGFISDVESQIGWTTRAEWRRVPLEQQRYDFIRLLRQAPAVTEVSYIDPTGKEKLKVSRLEPDAVGSNKDFSADPRFTEAVAKKLWFGPVTFRRGSEPYMTIAVAHAGRDPGVTSAEVNLKLVWDVINGLRVGEKGFAFVVTQAGRLIAHPDLSLVLRDTDLSNLPQVARALPGANVAARQTSTPEISADLVGQSVLTASAPISRLGWIVLVQSPVSEALAPVYATLYQTLTLLGFGLLLAVVAGAFLARRMAAPIRALQEGTERLGGGDLSQRVTIRTGDEIETLADRFNAMAARIQDSYETLEARVEARTRDLNEALEQQTATAEVLKVISRSAFELLPVFDALLKSACGLCEAEQGIIWIRRNDVFVGEATYGAPPALIAHLRDHPQRAGDPTMAGLTAAARAVVHIPDKLADPRYRPPAEATAASDTRTLLGVPLLRDGEVIGVFVLMRVEQKAFTPRHIELVETFADQAVIAIENARLFEEVRTRTAELTETLKQEAATSEVLNAIAKSLTNVQPVFDIIATNALKLCGARWSAVLPYDGERLHLAAQSNLHDVEELVALKSVFPRPLSPGKTSDRAVLTRQTVYLPDVTAAPDYELKDFARSTKYRSSLSIPMLRDGQPLGAITVVGEEPDAFTERQIALLRTFADQAVIAIENARLFEEVQAKTKDLEESLEVQTATGDVLNAISRSPDDLKPVLETIAFTARGVCRAEDAHIYMLSDGKYVQAVSTRAENDPWHAHAAATPITLDMRGSATARAARDLRTVHIPNTAADAEAEHGMFAGQTPRTVVSVPLIRDGAAVGVITLNRATIEPFTPRELDLLATFADQAVIAIANTRLFEEVQARTRDLQQSLEQQTATAEILNVIASSPSDMQPVFDAIASAAVRLIGCTTVYVMLSDGKKLTPVSAMKRDGQRAPMSTGMPLDPAANFPSRAAIGKTLVQIPDFSLIDLPPQERIVHEQYGVRSAVILPMMRDGACLGVLAMTDGSANKFTDNDIALAEIFCNQAVIGIANVRLFNETKESLEQQTATAEVLKVISRSAFDLDAVLDTLVGTGMKLCDAEQGVIWLKRGGELHLSTSGGYPQEWIEQSMANPITPDIDSATISGRVAATGQFVMVEDILEDQRFAGNAYHRIGQYRAVLMLPLLRGSNVEGTIGFTRRTPGPFNQRQIELVQTFADQAVIAIENARLFGEVQDRTRELQASLENLRTAQDRLVQSEKLASLGQLTAGIAHEIKNPLNFVNNFSALSSDLVDELNELLEPAPLDEKTRADVDEIAGLLKSNLSKVVQHGKRADSIVKNMLLHSREGSGERRMVDVNALVEESMNLAYHGARAERPGFNVTLEKTFDPKAGEADLLPQEVTRVLLNLISNGFYAANKRKTSEGEGFEPTVSAVTRSLGDRVEIRIRDNGTGIPDEVKAKIFNPFFTTKPAGEGTGLGLSLSHDIVVKQHGGTLDVETEAGAFTEFTIVLPRGGASQQTDRA